MARARAASYGAAIGSLRRQPGELDRPIDRLAMIDTPCYIEINPFDPWVSAEPLHLPSCETVRPELRILEHVSEGLAQLEVAQELSITERLARGAPDSSWPLTERDDFFQKALCHL